MNWKTCSIYLFIILPVLVLGQEENDAVSEFVSSSVLENTQLSLYANEIGSGEVIATYSEHSALIPASNVKLFSTALGWQALGPQHRMQTKFYLTSKTHQNGIWEGDLWVAGEGDPTTASKKWEESNIIDHFREIAQRLKGKGIDTVKGDIIISNYLFESIWHHGDWPWSDIGNYYGISSGSVNFGENSYELTFSTIGPVGSEAEVLSLKPDLQLEIDNQVTIGPPLSGDQAYIFGDAHDLHRVIKGSVPKDGVSYTIKGSLPDPELFFGRELLGSFLSHDIYVTGTVKVKDIPIPKNGVLIYQLDSPPLIEIVNYINKNSHNLFAEAVYKHCILRYSDEKEKVFKNWKSSGIDLEDLRWKDGCGLSPFNRFSAKDFCQLLQQMSNDAAYIKTLAVPGEEGTLKYRFERMKNSLKAKTGSIEGVYALSGILNKGNRQIVFSILVNNFYGSTRQLDEQIQKLWETW